MKSPLNKREETDWEVVEGFQRQDEEVQKRFYLRCLHYFKKQQISSLDSRIKTSTADDLFHEAFLRLWEELEQQLFRTRNHEVYHIDRNGKERKMKASLLTFLIGIAKNKKMELIREEELYEPISEDIRNEENDDNEMNIIIERVIDECVSLLPQRCKDILTKFYFQGLSLDEILEDRLKNKSKNGLKTGKYKCMSQLKSQILENFKKYNIKI